MDNEYGLIFTRIGLEKKQAAELNNSYINMMEFAVGDGVPSGTDIEDITNEKYRADINNMYTQEGVTKFDLVIPGDVGGFDIKEVALYDEDGSCIMVGKVPSTYKVLETAGATKKVNLRISTLSKNTENIRFINDDSQVYATYEFVNEHINDKEDPHETMEKVTPLLDEKVSISSIVNNFYSTSALHALSAKMGKTLYELIFAHNHNSVYLGKYSNAVSASNASKLENKTVEELKNIFFPAGVITMWSGTISNIPDGWYLCDGSNGTPDLRNKFIYGASVEADIKTTGGSADAVNVAHTHTGNTNTTGNHAHTYIKGDGGDQNMGSGSMSYEEAINGSTSTAGNHSHTVTVDSSGESGVGKNLPPYMKLAYIMKG